MYNLALPWLCAPFPTQHEVHHKVGPGGPLLSRLFCGFMLLPFCLLFPFLVAFPFFLFCYSRQKQFLCLRYKSIMLQKSLNALGILSQVCWKWERCKQLLILGWSGAFVHPYSSLLTNLHISEVSTNYLNTNVLDSQHSSAMRQLVVGKCIFK